MSTVPSSRVRLLAAGLLGGLVGGAVVGVALVLARSPSTVDAGDAVDAGIAPARDAAQARSRGATSAPVRAQDTAPAPASLPPARATAAEREPVSPAWSGAIAALVEARAAGWLDDAALLRPYVEALLERDRVADALAILQRLQVQSAELYRLVGTRAQRLSEDGIAADAFAASLRLRYDDVVAGSLGGIDPERLVAELTALGARSPLTRTQRMKLGFALERIGRTAEAHQLAVQALQERPQDIMAIDLLTRVASSEAEARLRALAAEEPRASHWVTRLAGLAAARQDVAEAERLLLDSLEQANLDWERSPVLGSLIQISPAAAYRWMVEWTVESPEEASAELGELDWSWLTDELLQFGRADIAIDVCRRRLIAADEGGFVEVLREHAPEDLVPALEDALRARPASFDLHGWLGDAHWRAGRADEARAAWERAAELDPYDEGDDDWSERLERLAAGEAPFED